MNAPLPKRPMTVAAPRPSVDVTALWSASDGRPVMIRPMQPADAPRLAAMMRALSPTSRHRRFHLGLRELPPGLLARLTHVDAERELALIACVAGDPQLAVAEARYAVADEQPGAREFALVVLDPLQGRGLGTQLLRGLVGHAQANGVEWLYGDVGGENTAMLGLAQKCGFAARSHPSERGLIRVYRILR